jgi:hypothetical protein
MLMAALAPRRLLFAFFDKRLSLIACGLWLWHMAATSYCHRLPRKGRDPVRPIKCKTTALILKAAVESAFVIYSMAN